MSDSSVKVTEAERELLISTDGTWAFCGYDKIVRKVAESLECKGFGSIGENNCGPIFRINDSGRALLQSKGGK